MLTNFVYSFSQSHDLSTMQPDDISNPVGLLQEFMQKNGLVIPEYVPGAETCPPFSWQVKLPNTGQTCTGIGNKKAEAKGMAARRMLAQIKEHGLPQHVPTHADAISLRRHPVSELQEYLQKRQISWGYSGRFNKIYHPNCCMSRNQKAGNDCRI